jgi:hypothetical protein
MALGQIINAVGVNANPNHYINCLANSEELLVLHFWRINL